MNLRHNFHFTENMQVKILVLLLGYLVLNRMDSSSGFWWPFSAKEEQQTQVAQTSAEKIFAPFEVTEIETKFLSEAAHYLGNLPKLDQCNLLVGT